jgi:excisionase family DNA binding protein
VNLRKHPHSYVAAADLARYWGVSRKQIYKQIAAGTLKAIRVGPRLLRISTAEAIRFEAVANMLGMPQRRIGSSDGRRADQKVVNFPDDTRQRRRTDKK